jgi:hypothetical protein
VEFIREKLDRRCDVGLKVESDPEVGLTNSCQSFDFDLRLDDGCSVRGKPQDPFPEGNVMATILIIRPVGRYCKWNTLSLYWHSS